MGLWGPMGERYPAKTQIPRAEQRLREARTTSRNRKGDVQQLLRKAKQTRDALGAVFQRVGASLFWSGCSSWGCAIRKPKATDLWGGEQPKKNATYTITRSNCPNSRTLCMAENQTHTTPKPCCCFFIRVFGSPALLRMQILTPTRRGGGGGNCCL